MITGAPRLAAWEGLRGAGPALDDRRHTQLPRQPRHRRFPPTIAVRPSGNSPLVRLSAPPPLHAVPGAPSLVAPSCGCPLCTRLWTPRYPKVGLPISAYTKIPPLIVCLCMPPGVPRSPLQNPLDAATCPRMGTGIPWHRSNRATTRAEIMTTTQTKLQVPSPSHKGYAVLIERDRRLRYLGPRGVNRGIRG